MRKPEGCRECVLAIKGHGYCDHSPLVAQPKLLIQGEAPGKNEILEGQPFVGKSGKALRGLLAKCGLGEKDVIFDNSIRCLVGGVSGKYPTGKARLAAEKQCRQYDIWDRYMGVPLLCVGGKAAGQRLGVDKITDWHGHIEAKEGRLVGCTYHPSAVNRNNNLIPLFVQEVRNLLRANANPKVLERPKIRKGYLVQSRADFSFDLEWDRNKKITVVGLAYSPEEGYSMYGTEDLWWINDCLRSKDYVVGGHNICTADLVAMGYAPHQIRDLPNIFDTMLAAHLVHPHWASKVTTDEDEDTQEETENLGLYDLGSLVRFYFPTSGWKDDKGDLLEYNGRDCVYTERLRRQLTIDLATTGQTHLLKKSQKLAAMTVAMHQVGVKLDAPALQKYADEVMEYRGEIEKQLGFNPRSWQQILKFAKECGIKLKDTKFETIIKHEGKHEKFDQLIKYKEDSKSLKTWFPFEEDDEGRLVLTSEYVHPSYHSTGTAVRRPSCSGPNDLNVPEGGPRILKGGKIKQMPNLRQFHIARSKDHRIVSFDFEQIENRMLVYLSGDKYSLELFKSGKKAHRMIAAEIFETTYDGVNDEQYYQGKRAVHAFGYCETDHHFAESVLGRTDARAKMEARRIRDAYFRICPGIKQYQDELSRQLERGNLTLRNPFGAVRKVYAQNPHERLKRAVHFMGCSTAADMVNQRAIEVWEQLGLVPYKWVYDELAYDMGYGEAEDKLIAQIKEILMLPVPELDGMVVPVKRKDGYSYGHLKEVA